jgi:hypothetical protein
MEFVYSELDHGFKKTMPSKYPASGYQPNREYFEKKGRNKLIDELKELQKQYLENKE